MKTCKLIIGLVGEIASGKDAVANYLEKKYNSQTISFSTPLRNILDCLHMSQNRENMVWLGHDLRKRFGKDILAKTIAEEIKKSKSKIICLPNVRVEQDIKYLKKMPGFLLINIFVDTKTRYERLIKRSQNTDDKTKTWPQFLKDARLPTEIQIRKLAKKAKYKINNNGTIKELYQQIEEIIKKTK